MTETSRGEPGDPVDRAEQGALGTPRLLGLSRQGHHAQSQVPPLESGGGVGADAGLTGSLRGSREVRRGGAPWICCPGLASISTSVNRGQGRL